MQAENQPGNVDARLARLIARQAEKRHLAADWARRAGISPGITVLDIGAGTGVLTLEYAAMVQPGGEVLAIDPETTSLAHAAAEAARRGLRLRTLQSHAETMPPLPFAPTVVMMTDSLHHIADRPAALQAIKSAMGPDSRLFIAEYDPAGPGIHGAPLARRLAPAELSRLLATAGFRSEPPQSGPDEHYTVIARP